MARPTRLIDQLPEKKDPKEIQILILGMPRTGVSSLRTALNALGYETFHGSMMNQQPHLYPYWEETLTAYYYGSIPRYTRRDYDKTPRRLQHLLQPSWHPSLGRSDKSLS
ncbi:hypothetical protein K469DRAFT_804977 [Zopfia rhizophila CBS 207.26]|uniref:P-loop containing nucleoside triphosphate hydrolase protein n=1 Tax=Zopfia rhizophila CBS 207.26 TaxID=1314779 RepID=A0A6A6EP60_9PEZI|nr:hypothetical protein K469DRAFT_804977 [Zopfia rhizophila CBS 207.26]